jgi:hypothetical protein
MSTRLAHILELLESSVLLKHVPLQFAAQRKMRETH